MVNFMLFRVFNTTFLCVPSFSVKIFLRLMYVVSRGEALSLKNLGKIETVILDCWAVYLSMIERNQDLALPNKDLKHFCSQHNTV